MKFELPYDDELYLAQNALNFKLASKKGKSEMRNILSYTLGFLLLSGFLFWADIWILGLIFSVICLMCALYYFLYLQSFRKSKSVFYEELDTFRAKYKALDETYVWEFLEDEFHYEDFEQRLWLKWSTFSGFRIIEDHIFFYLTNRPEENTLILGKAATGNDEFGNLISFLDTKIPRLE